MAEAPTEEISQLILEKVQLSARVMMSAEMADSIGIKAFTDHCAEQVQYIFTAHLLGNVVHREVRHYSHPASWWQGFKAALFPDWLRRHYPVRMTEVDLETKFMHACPHLNIRTSQDERQHLQWLTPPPEEGGL